MFSVLTKTAFIKYYVKCSYKQNELAIAVYLLRSHMFHFINASDILQNKTWSKLQTSREESKLVTLLKGIMTLVCKNSNNYGPI